MENVIEGTALEIENKICSNIPLRSLNDEWGSFSSRKGILEQIERIIKFGINTGTVFYFTDKPDSNNLLSELKYQSIKIKDNL